MDQTFNVRRRVRSQVEHAQRMWPVWRTRLDAFSSTPTGRITILVAIFALLSTPLFWSVLNFALLFFWLLVPLVASFVGAAQRRAQEVAAAAAAKEEERRRNTNPFAEVFRGFRGSPGSAAAGGVGSPGEARYSGQQSGPVVDAEFIVLDEDKGGKGGSRR